MSYTRFGSDSDVYVWSDNTRVWISIRPDMNKTLSDMPVGANIVKHPRSGHTLALDDREEAYAVLRELLAEGIEVPGYVFTRLYDEIQKFGHKIAPTKTELPF